jgi:hypothetical protein
MKETASTIVGCTIRTYQTIRVVFEFERQTETDLNNLLSWKDTPCHSVRTLAMGVGSQIALTVNGIVGDSGIFFDASDQLIQQIRGDKEFQVGLDAAPRC